MTVAATFDIETRSWDQYYLGGLFDGRRYEEYDDARDLFETLCSFPRGAILYAHGLGRFDGLWFIEQAHASGVPVRCRMAGERIASIEVDNGPTLRDSAALFSMPLKSRSTRHPHVCADLNGGEAHTLDLRCVCARACGGYCRIGDPGVRDRVREYLRADCTLLYQVLDRALARLTGERIAVRSTIGGSAWATAKSLLDLPPARWESWRDYLGCRAGYYGGRTEVYRVEATDGHRWDLRSAYPWALADASLPVGGPRRVTGSTAMRCLAAARPGIYRVAVRVPKHTACPPLPWRSSPARRSIAFPIGRFLTCATWSEIAAAEEAGATIERVGPSYVFRTIARPMRRFVDHLWSLRKKARDAGQGAWEHVYKHLVNSLTGKLAQRPEGENVHVHPTRQQIQIEKGWRPLNRSLTIWRQPYRAIAGSSYVHWAAALTAAVRIRLRRHLIGEGPVYCDTDSVYTTGPRPDGVGDEIGQWRHEGRFVRWRAIDPKHYSFTDEAGQLHRRSAGLEHISDDEWARYVRGEPVLIDGGVKALISAARSEGPVFQRRMFYRTRRERGYRVGWRLHDPCSGLTHPVDVDTLVGWERDEKRGLFHA